MLVLTSSSFRHSGYCSDIPSAIYDFFRWNVSDRWSSVKMITDTFITMGKLKIYSRVHFFSAMPLMLIATQ